MPDDNDEDAVTLGRLIEWLREQPNKRLARGFTSAHSDRGNYVNLAFEPGEASTYDMTEVAQRAVDRVFTGDKGGNFRMTLETQVFLGFYGTCGAPITEDTLDEWENEGNEAVSHPTTPQPPEPDSIVPVFMSIIVGSPRGSQYQLEECTSLEGVPLRNIQISWRGDSGSNWDPRLFFTAPSARQMAAALLRMANEIEGRVP